MLGVTSPCCCRFVCVWLSVMLAERLGCRGQADGGKHDFWVTNSYFLCSVWTARKSFTTLRQVRLTEIFYSGAYFCFLCTNEWSSSPLLFFLFLFPSGLESDDSCEVSFKDALVFNSKQENGVWERRWGVSHRSVVCMHACMYVGVHVSTWPHLGDGEKMPVQPHF